MELAGKNILFLGSSVTYGSAAGGVSFVEIMAEKCGFNYVKEAVSGTTLADINNNSYVARLKKYDSSHKFDLFVCQLSTNDAGRDVPVQETENAIRFIADYVSKNFDCPIVFYNNPYYESENYKSLTTLLNKLSAELNFSVIDFYSKSMSEEEHKEYMADRIHPTLKGYAEWLVPVFVDFLTELN